MNVFAWTFPGGRRITNVETLGAVATKTWTVPDGKRWLVIGGHAERDVAATFDLKVTDNAGKTLQQCEQVAAGATVVSFGNIANESEVAFNPFPLDEGDKIVITWGVAQTTPEIALLVLEIDV